MLYSFPAHVFNVDCSLQFSPQNDGMNLFLFSTMRATSSAHPILFDLIILIISGEEYR